MVNMKPYTKQLYSRTAVRYTIGISDQNNFIDQKRKMILVHPGKQTLIKVLPRIVDTSPEFDGLRIDQRNCKLSSETDGLHALIRYSRVGCEMDCAMKTAMSVCKCIPWHYPNNFKEQQICEIFGGYCFDRMMSHDTNYWNCKYQCLKDCHHTEYIIIDNVFPMDYKRICHQGSFQDNQFKHNFQQHFAFHSYKTLVQSGFIPDLTKSYTNGSLCEDYIKNYVGFVNVYSPSAMVILTKRDKRIFFYDQIGAIGGTFGLFFGFSLLSFAEIAIMIISLVYQLTIYQVWQMCKDPLAFEKGLEAMTLDKRMIRMETAIHASIIKLS